MIEQNATEKEQDMPEVSETPTTCPKCHAEVLDTFSYQCGSIRPNYVTPSFAQSEKCKSRMLQSTVATLRKALEESLKLFDVLEDSPELNPSNYTHDEVCELNVMVIKVILGSRAIRKALEETK